MNNTIALAYINDKNEVVAWSSDSFGTPYKYPKTYKDSEKTRAMLKKKFKKAENEGNTAVEVLNKLNSFAAAIIEDGNDYRKKFFAENNVVDAKIVSIKLFTDYAIGLPKYEDVRNSIDNKDYEVEEI